MAVERAVRGFYDEIEFYNYKSPRNVPKGEMVGHFTQLVWKESRELGVGIGKCNYMGHEGWLSVFHYKPGGNIVMAGDENRLYHANVTKLKAVTVNEETAVDKSEQNVLYDDIAVLALKIHNELRFKHIDTDQLTLSTDCCATAQFVANKGLLQNSEPHECNSYGENMSVYTGVTKEEAVESAIRGYYEQIHDYSYENPRKIKKGKTVGNFTQLVWKKTKALGVGVAEINHRGREGWLTVFHYKPGGNTVDLAHENRNFHLNVKPLKKH